MLIALDYTRDKDPPMSLGHASILANLRKNNIPVIAQSYAVNQPTFSSENVAEFILKTATVYPKMDLAMGAFIWNESALQIILSKIRQNGFNGRIILGGPQISYVKNNIEKYYNNVDVFIRGYAEDALVHLLRSPADKPIIAGVHYANQPDLGLSAKVDLNDLPSPFLTGIVPPQPFIRWETQRGCPFRCAFCQHRESDDTQKRRFFDNSRIMSEIDWIVAHREINDIAVLDPIFNSGSHYLQVLTALHDKSYNGKLSLQARIEMVTPEFLDIVERLNQRGCQTTLEFGLQTIHKNEQILIQRLNNMEKVERTLKEVYFRKIPTEVSLIFGLPSQTVQSFRESIDFCKRLQVKTIYAFPLMLLRGTPLYDNKKKFNLIESCDINIPGIARIQQEIPHVIASNSFTVEQWQEMAAMAASLDEYNNLSNKMSSNLQQTFWGKSALSKNLKPSLEVLQQNESRLALRYMRPNF